MRFKFLLPVVFWFCFSVCSAFSVNNALHFDGNNDYVELNSLPANNPDFSKGFSFCGWVKWDAFRGNERLMDLASGGEFANNIIFRIDGATGVLALQSVKGTTGAGNLEIKTSEILPMGFWCHVAATIDLAGNACIYFNGVLKASGVVSSPVNITRSCCYLGKSAWWNDAYFNGTMDEVSVWGKALSKDEVVSIRKKTLIGNEEGLVIYYPFNQGTALAKNTTETVLLDATSGEHHGTLKDFMLEGSSSNYVLGMDLAHIPHYLDVAPSVVVFSGAQGVSTTCTVKCDTAWVRLNGCDWVSVSTHPEKPECVVFTTNKINHSGARREAKIVFSIPGTPTTDTLTLYQNVEAIKFSIRKKTTGKTAQSQTVAVDAPVKYKASSNISWMTVPGDSIIANGSLTFSVLENTTNKVRSGYIYINSRYAKDSLLVVQSTFEGEGTDIKPFLVKNYTDLKGVCNDLKATYRLTADIDASASKTENAGAGFAPIGTDETNSFQGIFHGAGHVVSGLCINRPSEDYVALFGTKSSGVVDSLVLKNCSITGRNYVGALVGRVYDYSQIIGCSSSGRVSAGGSLNVGGLIGQCYHSVTVSKCFSTCVVTALNGNTGGLIGLNEFDCSVSDCFATGTVSGFSGYVGGLVGDNRSGCSVSSCYAYGAVSGEGIYTGGLMGINGGVVTNCYAAGEVLGTDCVGGLVGNNTATLTNLYSFGRVSGTSDVGGCIGKNGGSAVVSGCYYNVQTSNCVDNNGRGKPLTIKQMVASSNFSGWNFSTVWGLVSGKTYPALRGVNNVPFVFSDSLTTHLTFDLKQLLLNDCDYESGTAKWVVSVLNVSKGSVNGNNLILPDNMVQGDVVTLTYKAGELLATKDTLWSKESSAKLTYERLITDNALSFDGTDDYVSMKPLAKSSPDFSKGFCFAAWVKWDKFSGNERLIDLASGGEFANNIIFRIDGGKGVLALQSVNGTTDAGNSELKTGEVLPKGTWCHVAVTIDNAGNANIYFNGVLQASGVVNVPVNAARSCSYLGRSAWSGDSFFSGAMDEISIWNKALTGQEIARIRKSALSGSEDGLVLNYRFYQGMIAASNPDDSVAVDATSAGNNGALKNFALKGERSNYVKGIDYSNIPHYLNVAPSTLILSAALSSQGTFTVKCDTVWVRQNGCSWASFESSPTASDVITCTTTKVNNTGAKRKADIVFAIPGTNAKDTLTLYQDMETITLSVKKKTSGRNAQSLSVAVASAVKWKASSNASWITVGTDSVAAGGDLSFSVAENKMGAIRSGVVSLNSRYASATLTVIQLTFAGGGKESDPYLISSYTDLKDITMDLNASYRLTVDIDAYASRNENSGAGFDPIGSSETNCFKGSLNGGGHVISGLYINRPENDGVGLIGAKYSGTIDSLDLRECSITGYGHTGGLVGKAYDFVQIKNCSVDGRITAVGSLNVGGLVGQCYHGCVVTNCFSNGLVSASNTNVGGLIGLNEYESRISDCYATGSVSGTATFVGGLVGDNRSGCSITGCYATGDVTGGSLYTGGLAGMNAGAISNCYATGNVKGEGAVGGLTGRNVSSVTNCYSVGSVCGASDVSGCIGKKDNAATLSGCYYNTTASGCIDDDGRGKPLAGEAMMNASNFVGWDFSTVWGITENRCYPNLRGVNNAPLAVSDGLTSNAIFALSRLLSNDYDYENGNSRLTLTVRSISAGDLSGSSLIMPESFMEGDRLTLVYRVGEILPSQNILWGNEATATISYDPNFILGVGEVKNNRISLYPNPTTEGFYVNIDTPMPMQVVIRDLSGRELRSFVVTGKTFVEMNGMESGMYLVEMNGQWIKLVKK